MEKKINRFIKIYPWYAGVTGDLLFYVAIGSLFLTVVKGLNSAQIVSLTTISTIVTLALQFPILWVVKRVGNTVSLRLGGLFLLLSALSYTFGPNYYVLIFGGIFLNISTTFRQAVFVALENNLDLINEHHRFLTIRASGNNVYAILTMIISFTASLLFNLHHYLPMLCCILSSAIGFALSLFMVDYSDNDKIVAKKQAKAKVHYGKMVICAIVSYGLFFALVNSGQSEQKLLIQEELFLDFSVEQTSLILGVILAISRVVRVVSNMVFVKLYRRLEMKIGKLLTTLLFLSFVLSVGGSFIPQVAVKLGIMAIGYMIILFIRDPFVLYIQDIIFENTLKEQHQTLLTMLRFGVKLATAGMSTVSSLLLLRFPLIVAIAFMGVLAIVEIAISAYLFIIINGSKQKQEV